MGMDTKARKAWAASAVGKHERAYKAKVGERMRRFWAEGEAWRYQGAPLVVKVPTIESDRWVLPVAPPSWMVCEEIGLDDAIVGPGGEWKHAKKFLPIFEATGPGNVLVVASVADPCWVGVFVEGLHSSSKRVDERLRDGVVQIAPALDGFLAGLKAPKKAPAGLEHGDLWVDAEDLDEDEDEDEDD
jgi:hypothetical protein